MSLFKDKVLSHIIGICENYCDKVALIGDIVKGTGDGAKIDILCAVRDDVDLIDWIELDPVIRKRLDDIGETRTCEESFQIIKEELENLSLTQRLKHWNYYHPDVKLHIHLVDVHDFAVTELELNSPKDFFDRITGKIDIVYEEPDERLKPDQLEYEPQYIFHNERDLLEKVLGYYVPIHLRD